MEGRKMHKGVELTDDERAEIVEKIQEATRGMNLHEILWTIAAWEFMADDLRRVCALSRDPQPRQRPLEV